MSQFEEGSSRLSRIIHQSFTFDWLEQDHDELVTANMMDSDPMVQTSDSSLSVPTDPSLSLTSSDANTMRQSPSIQPASSPAAHSSLPTDAANMYDDSLELDLDFTEDESNSDDELSPATHPVNMVEFMNHQQETHTPLRRRTTDTWYSRREFVRCACNQWTALPLADGDYDVHGLILRYWGDCEGGL